MQLGFCPCWREDYLAEYYAWTAMTAVALLKVVERGFGGDGGGEEEGWLCFELLYCRSV